MELAEIPFRVEPAAVTVLVVEKPAEVEDVGTATQQLVPAGEPDTSGLVYGIATGYFIVGVGVGWYLLMRKRASRLAPGAATIK